jgi:hypothetical protein
MNSYQIFRVNKKIRRDGKGKGLPEFGYQDEDGFTVLIIWVSARGPLVRATSLMVGAMHLSQLP